MPLTGWNVKIAEPLERTRVADTLKATQPPMLILDTCQRLEVYGFHHPPVETDILDSNWEHHEAFERLTRIAAGIESRVVGELEVLGQVRNAYKAFNKSRNGDMNELDRIFQDVLALARKARRESGIDQNLTSLSGLAAKEILSRVEPGKPLAVIGTGSLASSVTRYLGKRGKSPIRVMSRCPERASSLAVTVGGFGGGLDCMKSLLKNVSGIICATAAPHPVLYAEHLYEADHPLHIVDLGEPPDCDVSVLSIQDVEYLNLLEIESRAHFNTEERLRCAEKASKIIRDGAMVWARNN